MQILFLAKSLPGPEIDGYVIRNRGLLGRFGTLGDVDVVSYDVGAMPQDLAGSVRDVVTVPDPGTDADPIHKRALEAFSHKSLYRRSEAFAAEVRRLASSRSYDAIWIGGWQMLMYLPDAKAACPGAAIIADPADDEVRSLQLDHAKETRTVERLKLWRKIKLYQSFEEHNLRPADVAIYVSSADAETTAARHPNLPVEVCQNGVDTDAFCPPEVPSSAPIVVFEGTMTFGPNVEGALHLANAVMPALRKRVPDARAMIVGRNPLPEVRAVASDSIVVTGTVDDVRATVLEGSVFVCPLLGGTGQKNKILQAWSMAMPIVATPVSVTGLDARHGENILLAEGADDFAAACAELLESEELRRKIGEEGRRTALDVYSVERRLDVTQDLLERAVAGAFSNRAMARNS